MSGSNIRGSEPETTTAEYRLSARTITTREVDVLVLGGGMSGVFAAIGASRPDTSVVIVEPSNVLGGQGTSGGVAGFVGDTERVNGVFRNLVARLDACGKIDSYRSNSDRRAYDLETCAFVLQELVVEAGVEIWLHAAALDIKREGAAVGEVLIRCGPSLVRVLPKIVIDATGNAIVADSAGARTVHLGPRKQLPMSLYFTLWNTGRTVDPFLPPGCPRWENGDDLPMTSLHAFADGRIEVKMKVVGFDAADGFSLSQAEIHARRQMMGLIYHLQTRGYQGRHSFNEGQPLSTYTLASVSRAIGQREGRRIVGQVRLSDEEVKSACVFDDAVAVGTYHLDYHWTDTEKRAGTGVTDMVEPYHIPLRAMRPAGLANVLCPGRSLSGDQLALSSYRAMATCAQMGLGAGTAAALAVERRGSLDSLDLEELKHRLSEEGQSLDLSDYGDYLRCLRVIDQLVPLPQRSGTNGASQLALCRLANGKTLAVRYARENGTVHASLRSRAQWHPAASLETTSEADLVSCMLLEDDRLIIGLEFPDGTWAEHASPKAMSWQSETPASARTAGSSSQFIRRSRRAITTAIFPPRPRPGRLSPVGRGDPRTVRAVARRFRTDRAGRVELRLGKREGVACAVQRSGLVGTDIASCPAGRENRPAGGALSRRRPRRRSVDTASHHADGSRHCADLRPGRWCDAFLRGLDRTFRAGRFPSTAGRRPAGHAICGPHHLLGMSACPCHRPARRGVE